MHTIVEKMIATAELYPDKAAIKHDGLILTYSELLRIAINLSTVLREDGLQVGDRVALVMDNSLSYPSVYYGVLLAGGVVVALNTGSTVSDLTNYISHAEAKYIVASSKYFSSHENKNGSDVLYKLVAEKLARITDIKSIEIEEYSLKNDASIDDLASIIYTSGTTGEPKGVMLTHKNISSNIDSIIRYLPIVSDDRVCNVLPFYYSYGNSVLHTNIISGATLILENSMMFPHKVVERMQNEMVTGFYGVASTYALLLSRVNFEEYDLSSIRYVAQAGGPMPSSHITQIKERLANAEFFMMYGQTEATARLAYVPSDKIDEKMGSAGKAIPGVNLEIRDKNGKTLSPGEEGEIYAKGENIMKGYWRNPDLTREVLIDGWLKTGDIGKIDDDGYIYMTGRRTDMIKSGANRISPKEIEEKLAELNEIEESAAIGIPNEFLGQVVKVFVVVKQNSKIDKLTIMKHCKQSLAIYKIPKEIEFVASLPKTTSGKIQRFKLIQQG